MTRFHPRLATLCSRLLTARYPAVIDGPPTFAGIGRVDRLPDSGPGTACEACGDRAVWQVWCDLVSGLSPWRTEVRLCRQCAGDRAIASTGDDATIAVAVRRAVARDDAPAVQADRLVGVAVERLRHYRPQSWDDPADRCAAHPAEPRPLAGYRAEVLLLDDDAHEHRADYRLCGDCAGVRWRGMPDEDIRELYGRDRAPLWSGD